MRREHFFTAITLGIILSLVLFTGCKSNSHGKKHEFALDYISETLDLTDAQEARLGTIKEEVEEKTAARRKEKKAMYATLKEQLAADQMDEKIIKSLVAGHREKMNQVIDLVVDRLMGFHKELTPDQKAKLIKKIEKFEKWRG